MFISERRTEESRELHTVLLYFHSQKNTGTNNRTSLCKSLGFCPVLRTQNSQHVFVENYHGKSQLEHIVQFVHCALWKVWFN